VLKPDEVAAGFPKVNWEDCAPNAGCYVKIIETWVKITFA
jgi:hypothetical protein